MRILKEEELDALFGGDDITTTTTETVYVTAARIQETSGAYLSSYLPGFIFEESAQNPDGLEPWLAQYYRSMYEVVPHWTVPTRETMDCLAQATSPGNRAPRYPLRIVNSYGLVANNSSASQDGLVHSRHYVTSADYPEHSQGRKGLTFHAGDGTGHTYLYANGLLQGDASAPYTDVVTGELMPPWSTTYTRTEWMLKVYVHEIYHQYYPTQHAGSELLAEGWGVSAVRMLRQGVGSNCPINMN